MHRSSEQIGNLAGALALAQSELANPEKSLTATIPSAFPREETLAFRYASLASGLDLVRKCLGKREIATLQTTAIDPQAGLVRLTTVLAHSSGEWVSSEWPVCPVTETNAPHRMGAALSYARRYALFTLVGIAGEDDLDAPDLLPRTQGNGLVASAGPSANPGHGASVPTTNRADRKKLNSRTTLGADASAAVRERLLTEVVGPTSITDLERWAYRSLPAKNTLTASDARAIETAFEAKLAELKDDAASDMQASPSSTENETSLQARTDKTVQTALSNEHDGSGLALPKSRRLRDKAHLRFVAAQPCLVCGRQPCDAHHLRFAQSRSLSLKVSDEFTVPLCRSHHRELHQAGHETAWWDKVAIDAIPIALKFWRETHPIRVKADHDSDATGHAIPPSRDQVPVVRSRRRTLRSTSRGQVPRPAP